MAIGSIRWEDVSIDEYVDSLATAKALGLGETVKAVKQTYFMATFMGRIRPWQLGMTMQEVVDIARNTGDSAAEHNKERFDPMLTLHAVGGSLAEVKQELIRVAEAQELVFR